jgi:hypothetical protein
MRLPTQPTRLHRPSLVLGPKRTLDILLTCFTCFSCSGLVGFIAASKTSRWRFAPHHPIARRTDTGMRRSSAITAPRVGFGELSHTYQPPLAYYHILPLHFALTSLREFHVRPFSALSNTSMNRTPKRQSFGMRRDITSRDLENRALRDSHRRMTSADIVCQSIGDVSVLPASHHRSFAKLRVSIGGIGSEETLSGSSYLTRNIRCTLHPRSSFYYQGSLIG